MDAKANIMNIFKYDSTFQAIMRQLLESAMEHSFDAIMITKAEPGYPIIYVNDAFTKITGYSPKEAIGETPAMLQGPNTDGAVLDRLRQDLSKGNLFHGEAVNYRKDGSEFLMEWKIVPIKNENEEVSHYLAIQRDVTNL